MMDPRQFFTATRTIIVAGKGGVGKTTVAAALGTAAAGLGLDTLLVEIEGKRGLPSIFGGDELSYADTELAAAGADRGRLSGRTLSPQAALAEYLEGHGLRAFSRTLSRMQVLDTLAGSTPGLRDLLVLGKIKQLTVSDPADLIIVDAPASGHALSFLRSARGLQAAIDTGPIRRQADEVVELLGDPARVQVVLVTLAEETPVNELIETAFALEDELGLALGPAVVNGLLDACDVPGGRHGDGVVDPAIADAAADAAAHHRNRCAAQQRRVTYLAEELPLHQLQLPRVPVTRLGRDQVSTLADLLIDEIEAMPSLGSP